MRRLAGAGLLAAVVAFVALAGGARSDGDGYRIRAIFDDAPTTVGADVQIAGATVGRVTAMDVTRTRKAALELTIDDPRFAPLHADARCGVIVNSLIGERIVSCEPGTETAPPLRRLRDGTHLLPVERTVSAVDLDVVTAILRRPANEQLAVLLTELGASTAARGPELNAIIHRANPGLAETDRVLRVLAAQSEALARLASDGDRLLAPLARERRRLSAFVRGAARTAAASADQRAALGRTLARLPRTLAELRPLMAELGDFAEQGTPLLRDLAGASGDLGEATRALAPFAEEAGPTLTRLGATADRARRELPRTQALADRLRALAAAALPVSGDLDEGTASFAKGKGIEHLLQLGYYGSSAANGFDERGHYLRAEVLSGACAEYTLKELFGCDARFGATPVAGAASLADYLLGSGR